jgi:hypothetical protein
VAFFDLLGFKSWVEIDGSKEVFTYVKGYLNLMVRSSFEGSIVHPDMSVDVKEEDLGYVLFSDSIVIYTKDDSYHNLKKMIKVCGDFMNVVICGPSRMIRGALAHGEFYVDTEASAFVGKALIDAYSLEGRQDWLALGIHDSIEKSKYFEPLLRENQGYIVKSLEPLRDSPERPYCINWASEKYIGGSFNAMRSLDDCLRRGSKSLSDRPGEMAKLERRVEKTRRFVTHYNP